MLRCAIALLIWVGATSVTVGAESNTPADFAVAIKPVMDNIRTAVSYARTGNFALAQVESDDAVKAWTNLQRRYVGAAPIPYQPATFDAFLVTGRERLGTADRALAAGDGVTAGNELGALRIKFHELRRKSGLYDLGDCVAEIAPAMEALRVAADGFNGESASSEETVVTASVFRDRLQRCSEWADAEISTEPEFRRLIDGAIASSGEIARAAIAADRALVHRYLIELQSYAQLLDFRFG